VPKEALPVVAEPDFEAEVLASPVPVLVEFAAAWCPPCRALAPILHRLSSELAGRAKIVAVDADEHPALAARFSVRGYPTVIAFGGGKERARHLGATHKEKLLALIDACR
jgi:thioredoxin 1